MRSSARGSDAPRRLPLARALALTLGALIARGSAAGAAGAEPWREPATGIEFVRVAGGEFPMGFAQGREEERPVHRVRVRDFSLGRFEVTRRQWRAVMGADPSHFPPCDDCPVEQVSWEDAQEFLRRASARAGIRLRLPTEAEWEYAARAGGEEARWPGTDQEDEVLLYVRYKGSFEGRPHPVGQKLANGFGLHDMGGNVAEWCADRYAPDYYRASPVEDPRGPDGGALRVIRGGSFLGSLEDARVTRRAGSTPTARRRFIGLRAAAEAR